MKNEIIKNISSEYGTPFYLYDESIMLDKIKKDVQEILMETLMEYQKDEDRNDDVTVIGIKI